MIRLARLPPSGPAWADLATKGELEERLVGRFEKTLAEKLNAQTRALVVMMAGLLLGVAGDSSSPGRVGRMTNRPPMREPVYMPWYERRRRRRRIRLLAVGAFIVLLGGALGLRLVSEPDSVPAHAAPAPSPVDAGEARIIDVTMEDGALTPARVTLRRGEPVRLAVTNAGHWFHDLYVDALDIHLHLWPGDRELVLVRPEKAGTFRGGCIVEGHEESEPFTVVVR